jgi:pectin methylesterase-like acyl-CoA thioesterase
MEAPHADAVVAVDGSGGYATLAAALKDVPRSNPKRYTIYVKKGLYKVAEPVIVDEDMWNVTFFGDGSDATVISGDRSNGGGYPTDQSGTVSKYRYIILKLNEIACS